MTEKTLEFPEDCRYSDSDEWARVDGAVVRIGVSDYAQFELSDVVPYGRSRDEYAPQLFCCGVDAIRVFRGRRERALDQLVRATDQQRDRHFGV